MDLLIIADHCGARRLWVSIPVFGGLAPGQNCFGREEAYKIMFQSLSLVNLRPDFYPGCGQLRRE